MLAASGVSSHNISSTREGAYDFLEFHHFEINLLLSPSLGDFDLNVIAYTCLSISRVSMHGGTAHSPYLVRSTYSVDGLPYLRA